MSIDVFIDITIHLCYTYSETMEKHGRQTLTVTEAAQLLGISRGLAYEMARQGNLPSIRFGRRILIPRNALSRMLGESEPRVIDKQ